MVSLRHLFCLVAVIAACFASASAATDGIFIGYSTSPSDTTSLTLQTSLNNLAFRWKMAGATAPQYAVGIAGFPNAFVDWTAAASSLIEVNFNPNNLPANGTVVIVSMNDSDSSVGTQLSQSITVGSFDGLSCASQSGMSAFWDPFPVLGGPFVSPMEPTVSVVWNNNTELFDVTVTAQYLQWGYTWVVDFAPFADNNTAGSNGLAVTNCENRDSAVFAGRSFDEYFNSNQDGEDANLNNAMFLAYDSSSPIWTLAPTSDCNKVQWTAHVPPATLAGCQDATGAQAISITADSSNIIYDFQVYVTAVRPKDFADATQNFDAVRYNYPFQYTYNINTDNIASATATKSFTYQIDSVGIVQTSVSNNVPQFELKVVISTNTLNSDYLSADNSLTNTSLAANGFQFDTNNLPANAAQQTWTLYTTTPKPAGTDLSAGFNVAWTRYSSSNSQIGSEWLGLTLTMTIQNTGKGSARLNLILDQKTDNTYQTAHTGSSYNQKDTFYLLSSVGEYSDANVLQYLDPSQDNNYIQSITNVYICYTTDSSVPTQCHTATTTVRPVVQLVSGQALTSSPVINQYSAAIDTILGKTTKVGFEFKLQPLVAVHQGTFYIEVQAVLANHLKRRTISVVAAAPTTVGKFTVESSTTTAPTPYASAASSFASSGILAAILAIIVALAL